MSLSEVDLALIGLRNNLEKGKELTEGQAKLLQTGIGLPGNRQELWPEYYFEPGLGEVAPIIEFGFGGLARAGTRAITKSKMYSDKIVDRWNKFITPENVYSGGTKGLGTLRTPYDVAVKEGMGDAAIGYQAGAYAAKRADEAGVYARASAERAKDFGKKVTRAGEGKSPQSMADEAFIGSFREGSGVYKIDMSDATKIYNFNKPSKYMKKEIKKEIVKLKSQGKITHHLEQLQSKSEYAAYKILPEQREFLERYGYKAWKHLEDSISTDTYVIFRPEKYAIKEVEKAVVKKAGQRALKSFPAKKLGEVLDLVGAT